MIDNTELNQGTGGDTVRDLARQGGTVKTQVVQLDIGGGSANAEVLIVAGQQVMAASVPVVLASNQTALAVSGAFFPATQPVSATALPLPTGAATDSAVNNANPYRGTCTYSSGVTGTVVVAAGARVVSISVMASLAATVTIFGGATIAVPAGTAFDERWTGFVGPGNIVFTNTSSYYVAVNQ